MENLIPLLPLLSPIVAAIVSFLVAWWTGRRTARIEIDKVVLGGQQKVLEQLLEARLQAYPIAYKLLSQLNKDAAEKDLDLKYLQHLKSDFDSWDSQHAYLLGPDSTNICYAFRHILISNIADYETITTLDNLLETAKKLELALRSDLGIYGIHFERPKRLLSTPVVSDY